MHSRSIKDFSVKVDNLSVIKLFLALFSASITLSLFAHGGGNYYLVKNGLVKLVPVLLFSLIVAKVNNNTKIDIILFCLFWAGVIWSLIVEYSYFFGTPMVDNISVKISSTDSVIRHGSSGFGISTYAAQMIPFPLIGLHLREKTNSNFMKTFYFVLTFFLLFALLMTISRAAIISCIIGFTILIWYNFGQSKKKVQPIITGVLIFVSIFVIAMSNEGILVRFLGAVMQIPALAESELLQTQALSYGMKTGVIDQHVSSVSDSMTAIKENPVFGAGFGIMRLSNYEHNYYIRLLAINGVVSFVFFILFLFFLVILTRKTVRKTMKASISESRTGTLLFSGLIAFIFYLNACPAEFYFYWIWFALTAAWIRNSVFMKNKKHITY